MNHVVLLACGMIGLAGVVLAADAPATKATTKPAEEPLGWRREADGTLIIRAKFMSAPVSEHKTRLLADLKGFENRPVELDKYGGWVSGEKQPATGFFYTKQLGERWWIIDPEGNRFINMAVVSVGPGASPQMKRAFPEKFASKEDWRDKTMAMLAELGFNGTGSWTDDALLQSGGRRSAYTPILNFASGYGKKRGITHAEPGHTGFPNRCIPIFDPEFAAYCDDVAARMCAPKKDDPWLLGWYSDNELPFPKDSLVRYLSMPEGDNGRVAAEKWLVARKGAGATKESVTAEDRLAWSEYVMEVYCSTAAGAIRKHDPNHMYLGPRFHGEERGMPTVLKVAGKYMDALAVNIYGNWDAGYECARIAKAAGKPVIVTEWYAKGNDTGLPNRTGAGWNLATQQERGWFYEHFTLTLLEQRGCAGWHWFKYIDNDPEDLKAELSNRDSNKGMVSTKYELYRPLTESMQRVNTAAYRLTEYFDRK